MPRQAGSCLSSQTLGVIHVQLEQIKAVLEKAGVVFAPGLTPQEFSAAEARFEFSFPPDLRMFLSLALPMGERFPNWRELDSPYLVGALSRPLEGLWFDAEQNSLWLPSWGPRPASDAAAFDHLKRLVRAAPALIPIQGHRYMPAFPSEEGNPVLSVHQSDIICYGLNLEDNFKNEYSYYFGRKGYELYEDPKHIAFWSSFLE